MKTLIIYAHPKTPGHCPAIRDAVIAAHEKAHMKYELLDLYAMQYDPLLHENEHYTAGREHREISKQNLAIQEKIAKTDRLVFIYPVWWSTMPAILKGFFDRILTVPFAFKYVNGIPRKHLKGKKAAILMTSGAPWWGTLFFQGNRPKKVIIKDILGFCGVAGKVWFLHNAKRMSDERLPEIESMVSGAMSYLRG